MKPILAGFLILVIALLAVISQQREPVTEPAAVEAEASEPANNLEKTGEPEKPPKALVKSEAPTEGLSPEEQARETLQNERAKMPAGSPQP